MKRFLSGLILALFVLAALPGIASAHAKLVSSTPADGAQIALTEAPTQIVLTFDEDVAKDVTTVEVNAANGSMMSNGAAVVDFDNPKMVTVKLNALSPGMHTVKWHAVTAEDNGQTDGSFSFTIVNNTSGTTTSGTTTTGGTTTGGTTTGGTTTGGTTSDTPALPTTGAPMLPVWTALLGAALLLLATGLVLRRARAGAVR